MTLIVHEIAASPNSQKVRIALGFKQLPYERRGLDFSRERWGDRNLMVQLTRQPRTPVLEHDRVRLFDSSAILRYLEANFPETPAIFSSNYEEFGKIEDWEHWGRKSELTAPIGMIFSQSDAGTVDAALVARANSEFQAATQRIEDQLAKGPFLVGQRLTAADIVCASIANLGTLTVENTKPGSISRLFAEHLKLGPHRDRTRAWVTSVTAYDH